MNESFSFLGMQCPSSLVTPTPARAKRCTLSVPLTPDSTKTAAAEEPQDTGFGSSNKGEIAVLQTHTSYWFPLDSPSSSPS
mmetsp:Transcript_115062/g.200242  ORF Transcript_115062/g.200242 Transcript_115062/m.200242 type:complete len:81 (+) Transcript_115062:426-668(+)